MPDYRRAHVPGGTYFFTVNTYRRQTFLTDVDVRSALREAIGTLRLTHPFVIEAWVLLPDHMHALWTLPPGDEDFSYRWRVIKRMVTQRCQTRLNRPEWMNARRRKRNQSTLWQYRFWEHLIRDEADFNRHIDYIHWNPVKHGYVAQVSHWPYSSFHRYVKQGWLPANWGINIESLNGADFGEWVARTRTLRSLPLIIQILGMRCPYLFALHDAKETNLRGIVIEHIWWFAAQGVCQDLSLHGLILIAVGFKTPNASGERRAACGASALHRFVSSHFLYLLAVQAPVSIPRGVLEIAAHRISGRISILPDLGRRTTVGPYQGRRRGA